MLAIVDFGMGNLRSLKYKLDREGIESVITNDRSVISASEKIILPGVGNFKKAMENLAKLELIGLLNEEAIEKKKPVLGICLGMQLMTKWSEEGNTAGLGWFDAETIQFRFEDKKIKIPNVGWLPISIINKNPLLEGLESNEFYFTHSYYVKCKNEECVSARSYYGLEFDSVIRRENITGTQFHPEKSHKSGFGLIVNFAKDK